MTANTLTSARPRRVLHGVGWVGYRQERTALAVAVAVLVAVCGWLLFLGGTISDYVEAHHLQGCNVVYFPPECEGLRSGLAETFDEKWQMMVLATGWLLFALPPALGLFLGAPLLARELETGTYRLAWTQSVSRRRWLAARLGIPLAVTLAGSTVLATVSTWWVHVVEGRFAVPGYYHWFTWMSRTTSGPAVVGFCVVSVAIGAAAGLLLRRVVPAMAVTAVVTAALRLLVDHLRFVLLPAKQAVVAAHVTVLQPSGRTPLVGVGHLDTGAPLESYTLGNGYLTADGLRIPLEGDWVDRLPDGTAVCPSEPAQCIAHHSEIVQAYADYQPPSAEWPMLWTEAGICLAVAAALTAFCFLWIRRLR
ncbi:ABC transporter permease subunit [Kitasatospora sp. NPDC056138]|uniref:ABC transporter permease subunit n=1 Tax=Kitasatospora sp. NPDC056138 TaxID=3345724 RepID=UPI0035E06A2F